MFDALFQAIEDSALSNWITESESLLAFPGILTLHIVGMAMLAGVSVVVALRLLGLGRDIPLAALGAYRPVLWLGFVAIVVSGVLLVIAYPTKAFTNWVFYLKLSFFALAMVTLMVMRRRVVEPTATGASTRAAGWVAASSLLLWGGTIVAGRLLAYTYTRLTVNF